MELPGGRNFQGIEGLQSLLLERGPKNDGHDLGRSESVRILIAQTIFWAASVDEGAYRKKQ